MTKVMPGSKLLGRLIRHLADQRGFNVEAIATAELGRTVRKLLESGMDPETLAAKVERGEPGPLHALCHAVAVGETYFFRHPEHFEFLTRSWIPELRDRRPKTLRAWSAGCATGEEAFSLAACLGAELGPEIAFNILGSDLIEKSLETARQGTYGAWSMREGIPMLYTVLAGAKAGPLSVLESCRERVRFLNHDLLAGPPPGEEPFDLIFCRNVLVYFSRDRARAILEMLASCLAPGGLLVLGSMDACFQLSSLRFCGHAGMQIFKKGPSIQKKHKAKASPIRPVGAPDRTFSSLAQPPQAAALVPPPQTSAPLPLSPSALQLHLKVLGHCERGDEAAAEKALAELTLRHPEYLHGRLERALWLQRQGRAEEARAEMWSLAWACADRDPLEPVEGLTTLPLGYLLDAATAYLHKERSLP
jgi:chemotaxis methyl-accepting protein methylase